MVTVFRCFAVFLAWTLEQESDGGVFNVGNGSSATFSVPTTFQSNSVAAEYSGGAVYVGGKVKHHYALDMPRLLVYIYIY